MNDMIWFYAVGLPLLIIIFTWASWAGALWFCARSSGWAKLAKQYGMSFPENSSPRSLRYLGLGQRKPLMYNNAIRAHILTQTLHLRPTFLAKSSHQPLAIPLADLKFGTENSADKANRTATLRLVPGHKIWFTSADATWIIAAKETG